MFNIYEYIFRDLNMLGWECDVFKALVRNEIGRNYELDGRLLTSGNL